MKIAVHVPGLSGAGLVRERGSHQMAAPPTAEARRRAHVPIYLSAAAAAEKIRLAELAEELGLGLSPAVAFEDSPTHDATVVQLAAMRRTDPRVTYTDALAIVAGSEAVGRAEVARQHPELAKLIRDDALWRELVRLIGSPDAVRGLSTVNAEYYVSVLERLVAARKKNSKATIADVLSGDESGIAAR